MIEYIHESRCGEFVIVGLRDGERSTAVSFHPDDATEAKIVADHEKFLRARNSKACVAVKSLQHLVGK